MGGRKGGGDVALGSAVPGRAGLAAASAAATTFVLLRSALFRIHVDPVGD